MKKIIFGLLLFNAFAAAAQTNIASSNPLTEQILLGKYNPSTYLPSTTVTDHKQIVSGINADVLPSSLYSYMLQLQTFKNRNTAADTVSTTTGIGAARRWVYSQFEAISAQNENRLIPAYLQFNHTDICNQANGLYKNIYAVLPGTDTADKSVIIIEGHIDSRCEDVCNITCDADGMEDNATGTALVIELARVMSKYSYKNTIVFLITIGEEQGLYGADAFAKYCKNTGIAVKAVLNNDVIGGIICGKTSSPPSCPGENDIDSTQVRLFSAVKNLSINKGLARYTKLQYQEELLPIVKVPMTVSIMNAEDRTGRGGDHIPFRQQGYAAIRFTSANEHGDANPTAGYTDRQHSTRDILGVDTDSDGSLDSFFVDFNYLSRNAVINGVTAAVAAQGIATPTYEATTSNGKLFVNLPAPKTGGYRVGVRTTANDFKALYYTIQSSFEIPDVKVDSTYFISVAAVNEQGIESLFGMEKQLKVSSTASVNLAIAQSGVELLNTYPNPFDESTTITVNISDFRKIKQTLIRITDLQGKLITELPFTPQNGLNEIIYEHGYNTAGIYHYSLVIDGQVLSTKKMVFTN